MSDADEARPSPDEAQPSLKQQRSGPVLTLHFDVNETVMVGDPAGGDTYEQSLNKILAKSAFVRRVASPPAGARLLERYVWHDGTPLDPAQRSLAAPPPPLLPECTFEEPEGCLAFYKVKELKLPWAKTFAEDGSPGVIYRAELERLRDALAWPADAPVDPRLCEDGHHVLLPAFFRTLSELWQRGQRYTIVVRTFGTDMDRVAAALDAFSEGKHPLHPEAPSVRLRPERIWQLRFNAQGRFALSGEGREAVTDEVEALDLLLRDADAAEGSVCCAGVSDDYTWWRGSGYAPSAGKPLWLTLDEVLVARQLFFDDNIHNDATDSIVAVRGRPTADAPFVPLSGELTRRLHGIVLRRVPTMQPILDADWFLQQIDASGTALDALRGTPLWTELQVAAGLPP